MVYPINPTSTIAQRNSDSHSPGRLSLSSQPDLLTIHQQAERSPGFFQRNCAKIDQCIAWLQNLLSKIFCGCCNKANAAEGQVSTSLIRGRRVESADEVSVMPFPINEVNFHGRFQRNNFFNPVDQNGNIHTLDYGVLNNSSHLPQSFMWGYDRRGGLKFIALRIQDTQNNEVFVQVLRELPVITIIREDATRSRNVGTWGYLQGEDSLFNRLGIGNEDYEIPHDRSGDLGEALGYPFIPVIREILDGRHPRFRLA